MNEEQIEFLRNNAEGRTKQQLIKLFREKLGKDFTPAQIDYYKRKYGIKSGLVNSGKRLLTDEQLEWIKTFLPAKEYSVLTGLLKEKFGIVVTNQQLSTLFRHKGIKSGITHHFAKGCIPHNKGKRLSKEQYDKIRPTMFKKGREANKKFSVGCEYVRSDGYVHVKVAEPNDWRVKHHVVWETYHEPLKKGEMLIFLDGNRQNCNIENLMLVTRAENNLLNRKCMRSSDKDITKAGVLVSRLLIMKNEKSREKEGNRK